MSCLLCATSDAHGWWGDSRITHCREYHRTWRRTSREAHCAGCHRHFGGARGFDDHLTGPPSENAQHGEPRPSNKQGRPYSLDGGGVWRQLFPEKP